MTTGNILLINDDERLSSYLREELAFKKGYTLSIVHSAYNGIELLKTKGFDLVITKFGMPDLEGINLIKELKKIDSDSIVIVIVDVLSSDILQEIFRLGIYEFLTHPINLEKLNFVVKKGIELHSLLISNRKFINSLEEHNVSLQK